MLETVEWNKMIEVTILFKFEVDECQQYQLCNNKCDIKLNCTNCIVLSVSSVLEVFLDFVHVILKINLSILIHSNIVLTYKNY